MEEELAAYFDASLEEDESARRQAEEWLYQAAGQPQFVPTTVNMLIEGKASAKAQHAAAVFLKNICHRSWKQRFEDQYLLPEEDKAYTRDKIFECMLVAPDIIRRQLKEVVKTMIQENFPEAFPDFKENILSGLAATDDERRLTATLTIFYQVAKKFKYEKLDQRVDFDMILVEALPQLFAIAEMCLENPTPDVLLILKMVIKVYCASCSFILPSFVTEKDTFNSWMQLFAGIVSIEVDEPEGEDPDEWPERPVWKLKKWTCRTLYTLFHRYGTPSHATEDYVEFSELYTEVYSLPLLELMWEQVQRYKSGVYVAPRVLTEVMRYLENALEPAATWKVLKPLVPELLGDLIFPLLCFSEADHELWVEDPAEYIRRKLELSVLAEINSPDIEAAVFLNDLVEVRKLQDTVFQFLHNALTECSDPASDPNPTVKDGALLMVSLVGKKLNEIPAYKPHLEQLLVTFVYPEFRSEHGFLRARACQVFHTYSEIVFKESENVVTALELILTNLEDDELPVRVQAAVALRCLLSNQMVAVKAAEPYVTKIVGIVLSLLNEAESDDLAAVLELLVELYEDEIVPHATDLLQQLLDQFGSFIQNDLDDEEIMHLAMAALGTLSAIQSIIRLVENTPKLRGPFEGLVLPLISHVLEEGIIDYVEEVLEMMSVFTEKDISEGMWDIFPVLHSAFRRHAVDFWEEICPVVYNYIKWGIGESSFPSSAPDVIVDMCRTMMEREDRMDAWRACKIMENMICWGEGQVDDTIPAFVGLAMTRLLNDEDVGNMLITGCVNVVLSALRYNTEMVVLSMESVGADEPLLAKFFALWFTRRDIFTGYHNRKLGILTLARLLELPFADLPDYVQQIWPHIIEMALSLFERYELAERLMEETDDEDEDEDDGDEDEDHGEGDEQDPAEEEIDDDEDYYDANADIADAETLQMLSDLANRSEEDEERDTGEHGHYPTSWDENDNVWISFGEAIQGLEDRDPESAAAAFADVTEEQQSLLANIVEKAASAK